MTIAVIGTGQIGGLLGRAFARAGLEVVFGSRHPDEADRAAVEKLIEAVGLRPAYLGPGQYDTLDGVLRIWFALAVGQGQGRHLGFKLLTDGA